MTLDVLILSRIQFGLTGAFHFIFPALSIGLAWLNVIFLAKHRKTQSEDDLRLAYFWINVFSITFAMGVATGVVMVFQFGSNWGNYTNYVGNMFGAPLAAEAIIAFFLEATFMGILIWGRDKVSQSLYRVSAFLVAFGATISAFLIIAADSWMQTPAGLKLSADGSPELDEFGRPLLDNFFEMVFNPSTLPRFTHTIVGCMIAAAMLVLGISAWYLLKKKKQDFALKSMRVAIVVFLIFSVGQWVVGHWHTVQVVETQPAKLAAFEGLFETTEGAELLLFGIPNADKEETTLKIGIPKMLSFLAYTDFNAEVKGLKDFPKEDWPPLLMSFFSYRAMLGFGTFFLLMSLWGAFLMRKKKLENATAFLKIAMYTIPLGVLATEFGWMAAEIGRQPWAVFGLLRTANAVSDTVPAIQVLLSIILFLVLYVIFVGTWIFLIKNKMEAGPDAIEFEKTEGRIKA